MKNEADKVFSLPETFKDLIVTGKVIQGQLLTEKNAETGVEEVVLQYWLDPDITPDFGVGTEGAQSEHIKISAIILEEKDDLGEVFNSLDKGMIYLFAIQGIDNAKLMRTDKGFVIEDVENTVLDVEDALRMVGDTHCLRYSLENGNWDIKAAHDMVAAYADIMGFGACELKRNVISLSELVDQDKDEDDEPDAAMHPPDVEVTINDDKTMTLSYVDSAGDNIRETISFCKDGMMSLFLELWNLGLNRGLNHREDISLFGHLINVMDDRRVEQLIRDTVLVKEDDPRRAAAVRAFLEMGTPVIRDLH